MARKRMLSPEVFTSPTVAQWPAATRWTWVGLLCYLDDHGYGEDSPELVKAVVWPRDSSYTSRKVAADLDRIAASGSICRFTCCGRAAVHIPTWTAWQKVAHPSPFRKCPCPTHDRPAHEFHMRETRATHEAARPSVVQSNVKSVSDQASDQPLTGSDALAAARAAATKLRSQPA